MAKRRKSAPSYRLHRQSGQAIVTLTCTISGKRRDVLLGEYDSPESRVMYARKIAEWEEAGRVLDNAKPMPKPTSGVTVSEVMLDWWEGVLKRYNVTDPSGRLPGCLYSLRSIVRLTRATCGAMPADQFGPLALQEVRLKMAANGWTRGYINKSIAVIIRAFKLAVSRQVVKPEAIVALECVKPLQHGELGAPQGKKIKPVPVAHVEAVKPHLSRQVVGIIDVMLLTGARCDEIVRMRPIDIDTSGKVWCYRPDGHKTEHRGRERLIHIGPKAQKVIEPFLVGRAVDAYLFSPIEAEAERREAQRQARKTPLSCGNKPGTNRSSEPNRPPDERYTTDSVRRAIERACDATWPPPAHLARKRVEGNGRKRRCERWETLKEWRDRLTKEGTLDELFTWQRDHRWTPHQLRHTAATEIRRAAGVEVASIVLGHSSATLTDEVYAERDNLKAVDIIGRVG